MDDKPTVRLIMDSNSSFSVDQEKLFQKCFEEHYDLFVGPDYVRWFTVHCTEFCDQAEFQWLDDQFSDVVIILLHQLFLWLMSAE